MLSHGEFIFQVTKCLAETLDMTHSFVTELLTLSPGIKTLFMSGYTADVPADKGVLSEGTHFLPKPFTIKDMVKHVEAALGRAPAQSGASP